MKKKERANKKINYEKKKRKKREERTKEQMGRITRCESLSPKPVK